MKFANEKDFQIYLGRLLKGNGFETYTDKKICELPTFHGDKEKPDLLIFYKQNRRRHKLINVSNPFAIETKGFHKLNTITKSILQVRKYKGHEYFTDNWKGKVNSIILSTPLCFENGHCYDWSIASKEFNEGVNWCINHFLFSVSNASGMLIKKGDSIIIEFHNCTFELKIGGNIDFCESYNGYMPTYRKGSEDDTKTTTESII